VKITYLTKKRKNNLKGCFWIKIDSKTPFFGIEKEKKMVTRFRMERRERF